MIPLTYFGYATAFTALAKFLIVNEKPAPADAIVVLAGSEPGRALKAAELFNSGIAPQVVITTEEPPSIYEQVKKNGISLVMSYENYVRVLEGYGVPASRIHRIEDYVSDTYGEMLLVRDFARAKHWQRLLIVTSNYHSRRTRMVARFVLEPEAHVTVIASPYGNFRPDAWWKTQDGTRVFAIEMEKLIAYSFYIWPRTLWKTQGNMKPPSTSSVLPDFS